MPVPDPSAMRSQSLRPVETVEADVKWLIDLASTLDGDQRLAVLEKAAQFAAEAEHLREA